MDRNEVCKFCWAKKDCDPEKSICCFAELYRAKETVSEEDAIQWCCVERCHHSEDYHNNRCALKLAGKSDKYPLNPHRIPSKDPERQLPPFLMFLTKASSEPVHAEPNPQKTLSDFF